MLLAYRLTHSNYELSQLNVTYEVEPVFIFTVWRTGPVDITGSWKGATPLKAEDFLFPFL